MAEIPPGTVVILKSGGPRMTVCGKNSDGYMICAWFDENDVKHYSFPAEVLQVIPD